MYDAFVTNNAALVRNARARNEGKFSNATTQFILLGPQIQVKNETTFFFENNRGFPNTVIKIVITILHLVSSMMQRYYIFLLLLCSLHEIIQN